MTKRILCLAIVFCMTVCHLTFAAEVTKSGTCGENLNWTLDSAGTLRIFGTGDMENFVSISYTPWQARNLSVKKIVIEDGVTSIGKDAFLGMDNLESVVMADSVTVINMNAFQGNRNLKNITLSKNLTTIGENAFYCCYGLTEFYIPEKVEIICDYTFYEPLGITKFTVDENNPYFSSDERGVLFNKDKTVLIQYPLGNKETSYTIPKNVQKFAIHAFHEAANLIELSFEEGSSITEITQNAFTGCYSLKNIVLPDSVVSIDGSAFRSCKSLESIKLPANLQKIGSGVFSQSGLKNIEIPSTVTEIGDSAFLNSEITSITIPDSVVTTGKSAFSQCTELETVNIGAGVTSISDDMFYYCTGLKKIEVSPQNSAYSSDEYGVLYNKDKTLLIQYPCKSEYKEYTIPDTVTEISKNAFAEAENLEKITLPSNLSEINDYAFSRSGILEISIPKTVSSIGTAAFSGCKNLARLDIPADSVLTGIGKQAFFGTAITEFDVPLTVTFIGASAFGGHDNLMRVTVPYGSELKTLGGNIFGGVTSATFYIPEGSEAEKEANRTGIKYPYTNEIKVMIDGERVLFDQHPVIVNDRTLVPMRAIFEALGAEVGWEHDTMTATAKRDDNTVSIQINSEFLTRNGEAVALDSPAILVNNRTLVPVRAVSESFGCKVDWNSDTREVTITTIQ